jgi:hypothetical protein
MKIEIKDIIEKNIAISTDDGEKVFTKMKKLLENKEKSIEVSFSGIDMLISHFLNESIGKLYITFPNERWKEIDSINYTDIDEDDLELLKERVIPAFKGDIKRAKEIEKDIIK